MDEGFLRLSRRFFSNELWKEARTFSSCEAWLDLIQSARFDATPRKGVVGGREISYSRGQYPASIRFLAQRWKWSEKRVRSFLAHLKKDGMITVECSQGMNLITLCNYDEYNPPGTVRGTDRGTDIIQEINKLKLEWAQLRTQLRAQPPDSGHSEGTNTKKGEEENNKEENKENSTNVEEKKKEESKKLAAAKAATLSRKDSFYNSLIPYVERYGKEMVREFYDYWSEMNKSGTKMRFEQQPTWETAKRLATWAKREKFNGKPSYSVQAGGAYTPGKSADHKAASRQSLEDLADAILGEYQAENRP